MGMRKACIDYAEPCATTISVSGIHKHEED
jgi:hypothetical protein